MAALSSRSLAFLFVLTCVGCDTDSAERRGPGTEPTSTEVVTVEPSCAQPCLDPEGCEPKCLYPADSGAAGPDASLPGAPGLADAGTGDGDTVGDRDAAEPESCAFPLDVAGDSPAGTLHFSSVSVRYVDSLGLQTQLQFEGTRGAESITLSVVHYGRPAWPPGSYESTLERHLREQGTVSASVTGEGDTEPPISVQVDITGHDVQLEMADFAGGATDLQGKLAILQTGWSLTLPFALTRHCGFRVNAI